MVDFLTIELTSEEFDDLETIQFVKCSGDPRFVATLPTTQSSLSFVMPTPTALHSLIGGTV